MFQDQEKCIIFYNNQECSELSMNRLFHGAKNVKSVTASDFFNGFYEFFPLCIDFLSNVNISWKRLKSTITESDNKC